VTQESAGSVNPLATKCDTKGLETLKVRILALEKFRRHGGSGYFHGLPTEVQYVAYRWLDKFIAKWRYDLPSWRLAILVGQAKRLALNPPTSKWGRCMLAMRGGLAAQQRYRTDGRCPTQIATAVRLAKHRRRKKEELFQSQYAPYLDTGGPVEQNTNEIRIKHLDLF